jgi:hypothetical protein
MGMLGMALVFSLAVTGCENDTTSDDGGGGGSFPPAKGKLTINGLGSYDGNYIYFAGLTGSNVLFIGVTELIVYDTGPVYKLAKISGGTAVVPVYKANYSATSLSDQYIAYEGNDTISELPILIFTDDDGSLTLTEITDNSKIVTSKPISGTFSNGNLTVNWSE